MEAQIKKRATLDERNARYTPHVEKDVSQARKVDKKSLNDMAVDELRSSSNIKPKAPAVPTAKPTASGNTNAGRTPNAGNVGKGEAELLKKLYQSEVISNNDNPE
ncbi:hypothetical protein BGZ65_002832 [Modicella reniformis]|uniref:Uncharacterized protein n=1 Tax=Modicella reniformis TaxID=1440133 RepID=A0A9P6LSR1_9FUNG|nr:hypothetical protein BGZ65_002832 [Modicella reniformis]